MHTPHCPPPLSPAASRRGDTSTGVAGANATSTSTSSGPTSNSLHVPPPEHAWSGAALARALGSLAAPIDATVNANFTNGRNSGGNPDVRDGVSDAGDLAAAAAGATPTAATPSAPAPPFFSLPYNTVEGRPMLSFAALLPTPLPAVPAARHAPQECAATPSRTSQHHHQPHPQQRSSNDAAPAMVRRYSNSSFPSVSASRATAPGMDVDHSAAGHAENSSQRRLPRLPVSPISQEPPSGTHSSASSTSNSRPRRHDGGGGDSPASPSVKAQKARTTAPSSFTDLFVGLEQPRRYNQRQRQREEAQQQQQAQQLSRHPGHRRRPPTLMRGAHGDAGDALDASMSPPSSRMSSPSVSDGRRAGAAAFMHDAELSDNGGYGGLGASHDAEEEDSTLDVAEDEDGASTPTVYRSAELPHWWRSLVTPDPGTTVNLRPDTRRLEFWWIDRLGSEAYEIISIVLRHNIEGIVLRNSGDSAVVVEFRIPARVLGTSSYAVEQPSLSSSPPPPPAVVAVAAPPSPPRPSMPASGPLEADTGGMPSKEFAESQHLQLPEEGQGEAVAALPAPLPVPSPPVGHTPSPSSFPATEGIAAPDAGGVGNQMETSIMSLGHMGSSHSPLASSPVTGSGDGAVGAGDNFPLPPPAVLMDVSPQLPQAPRLPGLVRLSTSSHAESLGRATTPTTANTTVNTNATTATTATTMTTMVSSLAGVGGVRLLSPLHNPTTPRRSETTASVATDGGDVPSRGTSSSPPAPSLSVQEVGGGGNQLAAVAMSAPSSPGPHHSISLANGSNTATVAGRSTDSSAEQDVQWRALARVLDTAVSRHQSQQPSSSQHPQPHPQQQSSLSMPPVLQAASYSTDAAVVALLAATTTDSGLDGAPGAAAPALRRLLRSEASLGTGDGERPDAAATSTSTSGGMATDVAFRLPRSPSAPQRSASSPRHHVSHPHTRTVKRPGNALASSATAAAAGGGGDGAAAAAGSGTAATPPSSAGLGFSVQSRSSRRSSTPSPMRLARGAGRDGDGSGGNAQQQQQQRLPPLTGSDAASLVHVGPQLKARDVHVRPSSVGAATPASASAPPVVSVPLGGTVSDNNCLSTVSRQPSSEASPQGHRQLHAVQPHPWSAHRQLPLVTAQSAHTHLPPVYPHHQHPLGNSTSTSVSTNVDATAEAAATAAAAARLDHSTSADASTNVPLPEFLRSKPINATPPPTTQLDAGDDSVVAVLTLPASVCTPIVVVRLHVMGVLHPLLRALALRHGPGLRSASSSEDPRVEDEGDSDGLEEALVTAAHMTRFSPPSSFGEDGIDNAAAAVRILSKAISELLARPAAGTSGDAAAPGEMEGDEEEHAAALELHAPSRGRDLSILYTVRSHVFFHYSAASLRNSLHDAEAALRCCAIHSRINATYEILGANLICFGYAAQVEGLAGHLRHRWRFASPLLVRFGRVTQVMMTYATMFLRQQLPHSMLRLCSGGNGFAAPSQSNASSIVGLVGGGGGFAGASFMTMSVSAYSPRGAGDANAAGTLSDAGMGSLSTTPHASAPVAVLSATTGLGDGRDLSGSPAAAAETTNLNAMLLAHALPFEVCPLLLGHYGRTLHNAQETPSQQPLPCLTSPLSKSIDSTATTRTTALAPAHSGPQSPAHKSGPHSPRRRPQRAFRPNADVCHRRLFLLETIYPSMNPIPVSRLKSVLPIPLARRFQGRLSPRSTSLSSAKASTGSSGCYGGVGGRGRTSPAPSHAIVVPTAPGKKERKVRAEDFMYDRDSMLALLAATADTTMRWGTAPMRYFARHIRLSATRRIMKGETLLMERPALLMPFWPLLPPRPTSTTSPSAAAAAAAGGGASESANTAAPQCCAQCGRQRLARFIPCPGECGSVYCSEQCRHLALRTYHIVECSAAPPDPHDPRVQECGDDDATRMRRVAATIRGVLMDWNTYLHYLARWDTPSTRRHATPPPQATTPSSSVSAMAEAPTLAPASSGEFPGGGAPGHPVSSQPPPPILAITAMRAVARVGALLVCLILPVELLPQMREHPEWAAERHAMLRAVARTLRQRGLVVPATTAATRTKSGPYRDANKYCTNVDPHHLLLMEVLLQQMSIPFFADFNYRAPSTVWERLGHIPCQVERSDAGGGHLDGAAKSVFDSLRLVRMNGGCNPSAPFTPTPYPATVEQQQQHQQRNWFVELTPPQREEVLCDLHSMVSQVYMAIAEELGSVRALPHCSTSEEEEAEDGESGLEQGLPGRWNCVDLFGYLTSTRAFQQISDFCLTSWAVVYPRDLEPPNVAAAMAADGRSVSIAPGASAAAFPPPSTIGGDRSTTGPSPPQNALGPFPNNRRSADTTTVATDLSHYSQGEASTTLAVPLAVISPWACLTVDLHPILGNVPGGVLYSRFMVEHEQRRRMLAYCAAAAGRRGGSVFGSLGGANDESFLSVNSAVSTSAAALLSGEDSLRGGVSLREDGDLKLLEEAAQRSCSNLHFSLVYTPSNEVALVVSAKKNINLGDVLWWESVSCGEYLAALL